MTNAHIIVWQFSEAGYGNGTPDGVGWYIKGTCDKALAY